MATSDSVGRPGVVDDLKRVVARTFAACIRYRVTGMAAEAAFFAVLSLPPLIFGLAGSIGFIAARYDVAQLDLFRQRIIDLTSQALNDETVDAIIVPTLDEVLSGGGRIDVISVGFVLALWSGSRALNVFIDTISIMYGLGGHRGIVKTRVLSFSLYIVALAIGIVLVPLVLVGPVLVGQWIPENWRWLSVLYWPGVLLLSTGFLAMLYHVSVPVRQPWRMALPGAVFTVAMWILGSWLVRWVLDFSDGGMSIFGPLAAPIALLLWLFVIAISVLIGAALNASVAGILRERTDPAPT
ncbi:YihY/virulence factor BrkB family protein [Aeromicrobium sp. YIM 150415]|uniref:YihY/virulence factor BrkB family protein n=1 Tax=Aeromicrobium sp. YIM 150415 TaxID=2803912 RepID=UPI001964F42B|nr:YihY/virulence factor BrkB family protein [Aeromicrobium sp. YIM 150415]MBM9465003.1 YihY/virulence factor BrkB family protein [Aeromicrobium sp. YIM 150415]